MKIEMQLVPGEGNDAFLVKMAAAAEAAWPATLARILEQSRLSGSEVVYNLAMFDMAWSPAYRFPDEEPVGWLNNKTGERRAGPKHPENDA